MKPSTASVYRLRWPKDEDGICHYVLRHFPYTIHYEYDARMVPSWPLRISAGDQAIGKSVEIIVWLSSILSRPNYKAKAPSDAVAA